MSPKKQGVDDPTSKDTTNVMDALGKIVEILQTSTIAEERGKDLRSKFWAAYKKVSGEFDDNMLESCNGNMDILLLFAGLFSAANTAFIIAMRPDPLDTTNALLVQLIQITLQGPSATTPAILSASTSYSSNFWMEAVAYMSLALSLLAAFGAVLGKQWLNYYKTHRFGSGSLEQRCMQRHSKYQGLITWHFEGVLQLFADLLKTSLLLFGVFLGAITWAQQKTISILIITATALGVVFYLGTFVASLISSDCPFQTWVSSAIHTNPKSKTSIVDAMEWMLNHSTNPDAIGAAVDLMPTISETPENKDLTELCKKLLGMFEACFDEEGELIFEDGALAYGKALSQFAQNNAPRPKKCNIRTSWRTPKNDPVPRPNIWAPWRALYLPRALEKCQKSYDDMQHATHILRQLHHQANTRSDLRIAVSACMDEFTSPDDEKLIWKCTFELQLDQKEVKLLMDCADHFLGIEDFKPAGDALLLLSGTLKSSESSFLDQSRELVTHYLNRALDSPHLKRTLDSPRSRCCHIALHVANQILNNDHNLLCDKPFLQAILKAAVYPKNNLQNGSDHSFSTAIEFLSSTTLPNDSYLQPSLLKDIQLLVLRILPAPRVSEHGKYIKYCNALKHHIHASQSQLRGTALRLACGLGKDLATISADEVDEQLQNKVLSKLPELFLNTAVRPCDSDCDGYFYLLRLVSCLASYSSWFSFLNKHGDIKGYIDIIPKFRKDCKDPPRYVFYLATLFLRIKAAHPIRAASQLDTIAPEQWWDLMKMAWQVTSCDKTRGECDVLDDDTETLAALVTGTRKHMSSNSDELRLLHGWLGSTLKKLESRKSQPGESILAVKGLKDRVHYLILKAECV